MLATIARIAIAASVAWPSTADAAPARAPRRAEAPTHVELDGATWRDLKTRAEPEPPRPEGPRAARRTIVLRPLPDATPPTTELRVVWRIETDRPGLLSGILAEPGLHAERVTLAGEPAPVVPTPAGLLLVAWIDGAADLELLGDVPGDPREPIALRLLPAVRGRIDVDAPDLLVEPVDGDTAAAVRIDRSVWTGADRTTVRVRAPATEAEHEGPVVVAHVGVGLTVGEGDIRGRAQVVWLVRRGAIDRVAIGVAGVGDDLRIEGREVASWTREGDTALVELSSPSSGRLALTLSWSHAVPADDEALVAVPSIEPRDVFRADASLQVARDGEIEVVPEVGSWTAIAQDALPEHGRGLVEGTPTASYERGQVGGDPGALRLLRFVPVPGPAAVVDVAAYTIATTEEGRLLARAHYEVRNERAAHLRITPPDGLQFVGVRVAGETALPARTEDGAWLVPLKRSLETVQGLLTFPVEVTLLGEDTEWARRERRSLALPTVDAPIAVSRVTLYLPPDYRSKLEAGDGTVVDEFTEGGGITYGLAFSETDVAQADAIFQSAVRDYLDNDFEQAQAKLDELRGMGASNENIVRLQGNVDLVTGRQTTATGASSPESGDGGQTEALARRVKEQARTRAAEEFEQQKQLEEEAEVLYRAGDYEQAEARYAQAITLGDKLEHLEQEESVEVAARNLELERHLDEVKVVKKRAKQERRRREVASSRRPVLQTKAASRSFRGKGKGDAATSVDGGVAVYDFDADEDVGDLPSDATQYDIDGVAVGGEAMRSQADDDRRGRDGKESGASYEPDVAKTPEPDDGYAPKDGNVSAVVHGGTSGGVPAQPQHEPPPARAPIEVEPVVVPKPAPPDMDDFRARARDRDFTAAVEAAPEPAAPPPPAERDEPSEDEGISLAGTTTAEVSFAVQSVPGIARRRAARGGKRRDSRGLGRKFKSAPGSAAPAGAASTPVADPEPAPPEILPAPKATASALSVVVPAVGQAVLYQQMLIEAGVPQTVSIDARRPLLRRSFSR